MLPLYSLEHDACRRRHVHLDEQLGRDRHKDPTLVGLVQVGDGANEIVPDADGLVAVVSVLRQEALEGPDKTRVHGGLPVVGRRAC